MYSSETFGRLFWVDDDYEFKSCPQNIDGTGDFDQWDYVSEWTDWEGVDMNELLAIHKVCILNKTQYAGSLSLNDYAHKIIDSQELEEWGVYSAAKIDFDDKELNVDLLDNFILKECN